MKKSRGMLAYVATGFVISALVWSMGCEQIIGLDGPYAAATSGTAGECTEGATEECYSGDPALRGIGACKAGTRSCTGGAWSACMGEGAPSLEQCKGNDDDCDGNAKCSGDVAWVKAFGGAAADNTIAIATDFDTNIVVAGTFSGTANFGGSPLASVGNTDSVLLKMGPNGDHLWSKSFGTASADNSRNVAVDSAGNVILVGATSGKIDLGGGQLPSGGSALFVAKFDPNGQHLWSIAYPGAMSWSAVDVDVDAADNVILSGSMAGGVDFGSGQQVAQGESLAIVKMDSSGKTLFSKLFGTTMCCGAIRTTMAVDAQGNIGVAGAITGTITFGNTMLTGNSLDVFVAKLSPTGEPLWATQGKSQTDCLVDGAVFDPNTGDFWVSGTFSGSSLDFTNGLIAGYSGTDAFLAKFNPEGIFVWGKAIGLSGADETGSEIDIDLAGNISVTGRTTANTLNLGDDSTGPAGLFVFKMDPTGNIIWQKHSDTATEPYPDAALAVDRLGHTLLTRSFAAPFSFGGVNLPSLGGNDVFVIKLGL